jgi:hypothetical protein
LDIAPFSLSATTIPDIIHLKAGCIAESHS